MGDRWTPDTVSLLRATLEATRDGIIVLDMQRRVVLWNDQLLRMFGVTAETMAGGADAVDAALIPQVENAADLRDSSRRLWADPGREIQDTVRFKDGRVYERFIAPNRDGSTTYLVASVHDVTHTATIRQELEQHRAFEEKLRQAQKMEAIGRLAGGIAHDINNALTAIAGYTELALGEVEPNHPARPDVEEIRRAAERAASVTRQLLAFSRKQIIEPRLFNLNDTVAAIARLLARLVGPDVAVRTQLRDELRPIIGDPGQIEQAIVNLAVNARDAMPNGGEIMLATSSATVNEQAARTHVPMPPGEYVCLEVRDTGHGISPEIQARIFEPFFTTKPAGKGTGLGLSMVYGTLKQIGGFIFVSSEAGCGTTFTLYFPPARESKRNY